MNGDLLFETVGGELDFLASQEAPFVLAVLTLSTHGPDAYSDETCDTLKDDATKIPEAISCTAKHVDDLIEKISELGLADTTVGAVISDHFAKRNTVYSELLAVGSARRNYVTF